MILTEQQKAAVEMVKHNQFSILTGKPGTGKTTATVQILDWADSEHMRVIQCAPTGKAAKRMMEATGREAATIHSTLSCIYDNGQFEFQFNEDNPLPADLVVVDEVSMVTNSLMANLLKAIDPDKTKVLLVGDPGQLPSVGAGAILRDMLDSGTIPHTELDIIHRNSGLIVHACADIHAGKIYTPAKQLDLEAESPVNLIHIETQTPERALSAIEGIVCDRMPLRGYNSTWDVQVISPVNSRGVLSCESINKKLRDRLNPKDDFLENELKFRVGDKIINTKNQKATDPIGKATYIVNGDMGEILDIDMDEKELTVKFLDPDREVIIDLYKNNLLHAYAITCHRAQGSEAPVVIIPVHYSFGFFTTRKWIYTAISRAKDICITVGSFAAIRQMIRNDTDHNRVTRLQERLQEEVGFLSI